MAGPPLVRLIWYFKFGFGNLADGPVLSMGNEAAISIVYWKKEIATGFLQ
jgi:hypothetical protein